MFLSSMATQNTWSDQEALPNDLILAKAQVYDCCDFVLTQPYPEKESGEYNAYRFYLNQKAICYRKSKITPTKTGQFVTVYKRLQTGIIAPFDVTDSIDFVIISVLKNGLFGQFIFPKAVLLAKGIFSTSSKEGKRALRVYPPWDQTTSKQAKQTQLWQLAYFYEITANTDYSIVKNLVSQDT
jgi:hypothetical protein